ncbi:hypothetical protein D3C80_1282820 [compost metagenome]
MALAAVDLGQGAVHVQQARPADQPLDGDPVVAAAQDAQDLVLDRVAGREAGVAAFAGQGHFEAVGVAHQGRDAEARARPQDGDGRVRIAFGRPAQGGQFAVRHDGRAPGQGLEVVDQLDRVQPQGLQLGLGHAPGRVGQVDGPVGDRSGHGDDPARRLDRAAVEEGLHPAQEGRIGLSRKAVEMLQHGAAVDQAGQGEAGVGAADVPDEQGADGGGGVGHGRVLRAAGQASTARSTKLGSGGVSVWPWPPPR